MHVVTDEELLRLPKDGRKYEIVGGEIVPMSPASLDHEGVIMRLGARLVNHVDARRLGRVYGSNVLYMRDWFHGRSPDLSFISAAELPPRLQEGSKLKVATVPDLVVEVASPSNTEREVASKVAEYLAGGVRAVWVIETDRTATVYHPGVEPCFVPADGALSDEDVLPGFSCHLAELFA